jgi:predicted aconitase with swiveling domain
VSARVIRARGLVAGVADGPALVSPDPISFLGDVAITTGEIVADESRVKGRRLGGTVLVFPAAWARPAPGASSTSSTSTAPTP